MTVQTLDRIDLENRVKQMYTEVAEQPEGTFHFEMGRELALRLGYLAEDLDRIPARSVESFAGVGYHIGLAAINDGDTVLDLGSGSGMDAFTASLYAEPTGRVVGIDMTEAQLKKAEELRTAEGFSNVFFVSGNIMELPFENNVFDAVTSNGVINLCPDKSAVFREVHRVLKPGGVFCQSDIVSEVQLPENIVCNASLWAACIGGAMQEDAYRAVVEEAGLNVEVWNDNPAYGFISNSAKGATETYKVKSISMKAVKG